jgi:hypothetical protein
VVVDFDRLKLAGLDLWCRHSSASPSASPRADGELAWSVSAVIHFFRLRADNGYKETNMLETELAFYDSIKDELLRHHEGKYVLIIGNKNLGIFDNSEDAYKYGIELKGNVPMLIKRVEQNESVELIPAMALGIINAHV